MESATRLGRAFLDGEHDVENFVLCSFVNCRCSPLLQGFLHECKVAMTCHFSLDALFFCQN